MFGDDYIAQHVDQAAYQEAREHQYRAYLTDALYVLANGPETMTARWIDIDPGFHPIKQEKSESEMKADLLSAVNEGRKPVNESV